MIKSLVRLAGRIGALSALAVVGLSTAASAQVATVAQVALPAAGFNGPVWTVAYLDRVVYVGGDFTAATWHGQTFARTRLAAVDAITGALLPWAPTADARVDAMATDPATRSIYIGGHFDLVNGAKRDKLAQLSTAGSVGPLSHHVDGAVKALAVGNGRLYAAGGLTGVDARPRRHAAAFSLTTGSLDPRWTPRADDIVDAIVADTVSANRVYLGGQFLHVNAVSGTAHLAAVNPVTGALDPTFKAAAPYWVRALALGRGGLYVGMSGPGGDTVRYRQDGSVVWKHRFDGDPQALAFLLGTLYVGGHFDHACRATFTTGKPCRTGLVSRVKLAALDAATGRLLSWNPTANGVAGVLAMSAERSLSRFTAVGEFTTVAGQPAMRFAEFV